MHRHKMMDSERTVKIQNARREAGAIDEMEEELGSMRARAATTRALSNRGATPGDAKHFRRPLRDALAAYATVDSVSVVQRRTIVFAFASSPSRLSLINERLGWRRKE